ncbi:MAG: acyl-ACP--UDP-N-acetylglucosamine O-acyltransferase [Puniceicoccales bacterium]|jgi:UDP-N-acetylglucosamine acyltransferase|nr:acyl-ACP--UDP-N-acetylglucosamine O-acyltransferase [Puniceicoccales bacterium]
MLSIHKTAIVGEDVSLGDGSKIGAYATVENGVSIGHGTTIGEHAIVRSGTVIGNGSLIDSFAVIGGIPQDISFDVNLTSGVAIGDNTSVREYATVHRSAVEFGTTMVGSNCMLQSGTHVAHDCEVGDGAVIASTSILGGKVKLGKKCFIGGGAAVHQDVTIGEYAILAGTCAASLDIPPYTIAAGDSLVIGINLIALHRADIPAENISALRNCFREFYVRTGPFSERAKSMLAEGYGKFEETEKFLNFFLRNSKRGFAHKRCKIFSHESE